MRTVLAGVLLLSLSTCRSPSSPRPPDDRIAEATQPEPAPEPKPEPEPEPPPPPPWTPEDVPRIQKYQPLVHAAAREHNLDPHVVNAIIWHESKFHANARGPGGAAGLMQLMPTTSRAVAKKLGRKNRPFDPKYNVAAGTWLLARLLEIFDGDERLALAGYALGSGAVRKRLEAKQPLPDKTQRFIRRVDEWSKAFRAAEAELGGASQAAIPSAASF